MNATIEALINRVARERFDITRPGLPTYLTRWTLWGGRFKDGRKVFLHLFRRSDPDTLHDHPWPYTSVILWGGYYEETFTGYVDPTTRIRETDRRWYGPGSVVRRSAEHAHRVVLPEGGECLTLFFPGTKVRSWGFHCATGWLHWTDFQANLDAGRHGCGEEVPGA